MWYLGVHVEGSRDKAIVRTAAKTAKTAAAKKLFDILGLERQW